jgi:hypothetical protein
MAMPLACADSETSMSIRDAGPDAEQDEASEPKALTACPDKPFDHADAPCVGDFLCRTPVKCCSGGTVCSENAHQCMNGSLKYLGFNDTCFGQPP